MDSNIRFTGKKSPRIAYVRPVDAADLSQDLQEQAEGADNLYAVHDENGQRLALVNGRRLAFLLARQNHLAPVNVH